MVAFLLCNIQENSLRSELYIKDQGHKNLNCQRDGNPLPMFLYTIQICTFSFPGNNDQLDRIRQSIWVLGVSYQRVPLSFSTYSLNGGSLQLGCQLSVKDLEKYLYLTGNQNIHVLDAAPPVSFSVPTIVGVGVRETISPIQLICKQIFIFEIPRSIFDYDIIH